MEIHPLLFINTPSFYREPIEIEESTSVYELLSTPPEKIQNSLIARQLHFFSRPSKDPRPLLLVLKSGEKFVASIENLNECEVRLQCFDSVRIINGNEIVAIYSSS
ncbi:4-diphosphocytidyl-2C-methyl-D-erythritol kinase [Solibacillus sp. R5-41]|uniref:4-diphosphocytidyl-2C-methyl-D-erythritol kinase n=1 Tax=Solibacillus sp. R5-41 TaxID=2048654 RepID=UPI000C127F51|nr:4-diphosphocytidyl-2C-methyl-D-erythritol kinase [Solibacillus sp. R5-41]ATP39134.1 4-diphosphocytidyl-2C-methyl-D-erythritol kinase [Solibacillus sp. R5-41]